LLLGVAAAVLSLKYRRNGCRLLLTALLALYICSIPLTATLLSRAIQSYHPLPAQIPSASDTGGRAIVVLAGGISYYAPEYGGDDIALRTLGRLRYAAQLARRSGLPLLVSGGSSDPDRAASLTEGVMMQRIAQSEFALDNPIWVEDSSRTTRENASNSSRILKAKGINTILLVTQAAHMARAVTAFQRNGMQVIAAPTLFFNEQPDALDINSWIPSAAAIDIVRYVLHEWLGRLWYWLQDEVY
jgi:uncharacterized SAM-binding protein YcdF (DUF218 family)